MNTILHIDINSYFATMLQQKYPHLRHKPVGVLKDIGRSCVIAASKEAKLFGIKTGDSASRAKHLAPHIVFVPAEFDYYLDSTKKLKSLFNSIAPHVEIFSLDEAFIDISDCGKHLYPNPHTLAVSIQEQIKLQLGEWVTCNIGISHNRFLAKMISEVSPKGSISFLDSSSQDYYLATTPFSSVCGIGTRLERKLNYLNIHNLYAINFLSDQFLHRHFGPFWSKQLQRMASGLEPHLFNFIDHLPYAKSIGRSITGYQLTRSNDQIKAILYNLCIEIIYKARKMGLAGRQVSLSLWGGAQFNFRDHFHRHLTLTHYLSHTQELFHYIYHILYQSWDRSFPVIKFAVSLNLLKPVHQLPLSLLPDWHKQEQVSQALDTIQQKFGLFTVRSALLSRINIIHPEVTGFLGDKKFQFLE